ncbi:hypothetical protein EUTSA_v10028569mg [Eutrema salsugineum]|uniref:PUM-HD domain-containing protein n=1 Tax=Eutrema salsugineum TaxID=72664 RepID=V4N0Z6_EUTSA|nr:hypothetical protein EUTSA_v10028569mg [Eutrema salsugineum]
MAFSFFAGDLRERRASHFTDSGFGEFPTASFSHRFQFSGDRKSPFVHQQLHRNLLKLNTTASVADFDLGLCQNLSRMSISDEQRAILSGSSPFLGFSGSRNLCSWLDPNPFLEVSSRREGLLHSSHGEMSMGSYVGDGDFHRSQLLSVQDYPSTSQNREHLPRRFNASLKCRGNNDFPPFSAMRGSQELACTKNNNLFKEAFSGNEQDFPLNLASMVGMYGSVYLMAKDQMGCRILQKLLEGGSLLDSMIIFNEVINHVIEIGTDQFGNYFMQKLLEVCNEEQRTQILIMLTAEPGLLVKISLNYYGTRVVQKLIETVSTKTQINLVKSALEPGLLSLVRDLHGKHVVQSCLKSFGPDDNKFVLEDAIRFCTKIATHNYGCLVMQDCIKYSAGEQRENLVAEISRNSLHLAQDPFGNYVVQYMIEQKLGGESVMFELRGNYVNLARQKCSSHVVEKCLVHYPESRSQIVRELISVPNFEELLLDPFANYVIQSALSKTKGNVRASLVEKVQRFQNLRTNPYCKKIFSKGCLLRI